MRQALEPDWSTCAPIESGRRLWFREKSCSLEPNNCKRVLSARDWRAKQAQKPSDHYVTGRAEGLGHVAFVSKPLKIILICNMETEKSGLIG